MVIYIHGRSPPWSWNFVHIGLHPSHLEAQVANQAQTFSVSCRLFDECVGASLPLVQGRWKELPEIFPLMLSGYHYRGHSHPLRSLGQTRSMQQSRVCRQIHDEESASGPCQIQYYFSKEWNHARLGPPARVYLNRTVGQCRMHHQ